MRKAFLWFVAIFLLAQSIIFFIIPYLLYEFIHGDYERYVWIINGPYPFSQFGSGPFQLWMGVGLVVLGLFNFIISIVMMLVAKKYE